MLSLAVKARLALAGRDESLMPAARARGVWAGCVFLRRTRVSVERDFGSICKEGGGEKKKSWRSAEESSTVGWRG